MGVNRYSKGFLEYQYQALSDVGRARSNNEDSLIETPALGLFGVCDGLGGHAAGEVASFIASYTVTELVEKASEPPEEVLKKGIQEANCRIIADQTQNPERAKMGTTVSALWLTAEGFDDGSGLGWIGHVGDSRIYLQRGNQFAQLTDDHSPVFRLHKHGLLSKAQMDQHPNKNLLDRCLGLTPTVEVDVFPVSLRSEDRILICTDGVSDAISDEEIRLALGVGPVSEAANQLVSAANDKGGRDNITLVLVEVLKS